MSFILTGIFVVTIAFSPFNSILSIPVPIIVGLSLISFTSTFALLFEFCDNIIFFIFAVSVATILLVITELSWSDSIELIFPESSISPVRFIQFERNVFLDIISPSGST